MVYDVGVRSLQSSGPKRKRPTKREFAAARKLFMQRACLYLDSRPWVKKIRESERIALSAEVEYEANTPVGSLKILVWEGAIMCRFAEPERACRLVACSQPCGKWNHHFCQDNSVRYLVDSVYFDHAFRLPFERLMLGDRELTDSQLIQRMDNDHYIKAMMVLPLEYLASFALVNKEAITSATGAIIDALTMLLCNEAGLHKLFDGRFRIVGHTDDAVYCEFTANASRLLPNGGRDGKQ